MATYDLSLAAEDDLRGTWRYTYDTWGIEQAERYFDDTGTPVLASASGQQVTAQR